jgi:hypothetical protein
MCAERLSLGKLPHRDALRISRLAHVQEHVIPRVNAAIQAALGRIECEADIDLTRGTFSAVKTLLEKAGYTSILCGGPKNPAYFVNIRFKFSPATRTEADAMYSPSVNGKVGLPTPAMNWNFLKLAAADYLMSRTVQIDKLIQKDPDADRVTIEVPSRITGAVLGACRDARYETELVESGENSTITIVYL